MPGASQLDKYLRSLRENIQEFRNQRGLTQMELSEQCGFCPSYIGKIERDEKDPSLFAFLCIAEALDAEPAELFNEIDEPVEAV